jgi:glycosyltransferase involved in cell wall biosynthesis
VVFTGFIDNQRMLSALYRGSDVLVHASEFEPWGLVINEAAAAGMAMVVTDVTGAAAELVQEGENGRLFEANDQQGLNDALLDVSSPDRIDRIKAANEPIIREWRSAGDPVKGLRRALSSCGVIK